MDVKNVSIAEVNLDTGYSRMKILNFPEK